jgi:hypothetical protein
LVEEYRRNEQKHREAAALARENKLRQHKGLKPRDPDAERAAATPEEEKALGDAVLQEAAQILLDMQGPSGTVALKSGVN